MYVTVANSCLTSFNILTVLSDLFEKCLRHVLLHSERPRDTQEFVKNVMQNFTLNTKFSGDFFITLERKEFIGEKKCMKNIKINTMK